MKKLFLMVLVFVFGACALVAAATEYTDTNVPINVNVGDEFIIKLKTNQTAGFRWQLAESDEQVDVVKFVNTEYKHNPIRVLGGGAEEYWKFKAVNAGTAPIELKYVSSVDTIAPADTKNLLLM